MTSLKEHQIAAGLDVAKTPIGRGWHIFSKRDKLPITTWALTAEQVAKLYQEAMEVNRYSIPWGDIEGVGKPLRRYIPKKNVSYVDMSEVVK